MFLSLGLFNDSPIWENKNLLRIKVNVFTVLNELIYGLKGRSIFPLLNSSTITNLSNKFLGRGPVNCAADDLDLSLGGTNDQIEFFNNFIINNVDSVGAINSSTNGSGYGSGHPSNPFGDDMGVSSLTTNYGVYQGDVSNQYNGYPAHQTGQQNFQSYTNNYDDSNGEVTNDQIFSMQSIYDFDYNQKSFSAVPMVQNYAEMQANHNISIVDDGSPYFHDFRRTVNQKQHSDPAFLYGSSQESNISPVDEEMARKVHVTLNKKRKFDSVSSSDSNISPLHQDERNLNRTSYDVDNLLNEARKHHHVEMIHHVAPNNSVPSMGDGIMDYKKAGKKSRKMRLSNADGTGMSYECPQCDAKFKVKGYLTRHLKKHNSSKAFVCPFFKEPSHGEPGSKCHPTGGFSRRDTYKTHLKALHFIYPPGTKSNERNMISGRCAGCFKHFNNNYKWLENHIETGECNGTVIFKGSEKQSGSILKGDSEIVSKTESEF